MARFKVGDRRSSAPRLKRRFQILVSGTILFMVCVSFYILQPEFLAKSSVDSSGNSWDEAEPVADIMVNRIDLPPSEVKLRDGEVLPGSSLEKVMEQLILKYHVDLGTQLNSGQSPWQLAASWVTARQVLPELAPELGAVLKELATAPIVAVSNGVRGTQLKMSMVLAGGQAVVFKPMWYERNLIIDGPPYAGRDRHNGEIAAFHLSRILGLRRTPLAVGRRVSLQHEIIPVADKDLLETFHHDGGKTCFYGKCLYCNKENSLCIDGDVLEGTVILWLPPSIRLKLGRNPWRRTYREKITAKWEEEENYCSIVRQIEPFVNDSSLLIDLIDTTVFDYLIGNADRHHYEVVAGAQNGMLVMLDNGKSFGNPFQDERSILAPLYQCCSIRFATWQRLLTLQNGILSSVLREVLRSDPVSPVLTMQHLQALDRRLEKILLEVQHCIKTKGLKSVILEQENDIVL